MDLKRWNLRRYELRDEDGGDPAVVRYRPVTGAWRLRLLENDLQAMRPGATAEDDEAEVSSEAIAEKLAGLSGQLQSASALWLDLLLDLVHSVEGLTMGSESLSTEDAIRALVDMEAPAKALVKHMLAEAEVTADQEKF
jgi:hypothetical protein